MVIADTGSLRGQLMSQKADGKLLHDLVTDIVDRSHVLENIHSRIGNLPTPDEIEADINGYWTKERLWNGKPDLLRWLRRKFEASSVR